MTRRARLPWCGKCDEDSRLMDSPTGEALRCPTCHAGAVKARGAHSHDHDHAKERRRYTAQALQDECCPACGERIHHTHRCRASSMDPRSLAHPASIREVRIAAGGDA